MLLAGGNVFLTDAQIFELTRQGRLACGIGEPCRIVEGERSTIDLQPPRRLQCDETGRNCKFQATASERSL